MVGQLLKWGFSWRTVSQPRSIGSLVGWLVLLGPLEDGVELDESVDFDDFFSLVSWIFW